MRIEKNTKFLIVGLGLIGGCYAQGLSGNGYYVGAVDPSLDSLSFALGEGFIKEGKEKPGEWMRDYDIIVLSLYPSLIIDWVKENQCFLKPNAIITDTAGIKGLFVSEVESLLRPDLEYIGAHPMAGRELSGVRNSDASIFHNANYIVTPTDRNSEKAIGICREIGEILGFANIVSLTPKEHDEMIGYLSQLTHVIAMALMICKDNESYVNYTGDSFRDLTRIAKINDALWSELFLSNKEALLSSIDSFMNKMGELRKFIEEGDAEALRKDMRLSKDRRMLFEKKKK